MIICKYKGYLISGTARGYTPIIKGKKKSHNYITLHHIITFFSNKKVF